MFWPTPTEEMDIDMGLPTSTVRGKSFRMEAWQTLSSHTTSRQGYCPTLPAPWFWNIYLRLPHKCPSFVGQYSQYSSTMVRIWVHRDNAGHCPKSGLRLKPCSDQGGLASMRSDGGRVPGMVVLRLFFYNHHYNNSGIYSYPYTYTYTCAHNHALTHTYI